MLIAYLDEFGHVGPYVDEGHKKFFHHPVFGYAGFVIDASRSRDFGALFAKSKKELFRTEIEKTARPHQWERKGNEFFSTGSINSHPEQIRVFNRLVQSLRSKGGAVFYYGEEKARGTLKQTGVGPDERTSSALRETINRLCTHADSQDQEILIIMDQITEKSRIEMIAKMYAHVYRRSSAYQEHPEMRRIVEAPLHIESNLNSSVQFADWICALMARISHWQLVADSQFDWAPRHFAESLRGGFTFESKIYMRNGAHINHSAILYRNASSFAPGTVGAGMPEGFIASLRASTNPRRS